MLKELCVSKVNTLKISPDGRIALLAGFGNMHGDIEIYRLSDYACIGKTKFYCGVSLSWSVDCKYLLGAVLSPRVRVDNEYKIFTYNGEELINEKFSGEIYECEWINSGEYQEYPIEVSQSFSKLKQVEKEKKPNETKQAYSFNPAKKGSIPGLKKK
jgi:translation initiation factor 2A